MNDADISHLESIAGTRITPHPGARYSWTCICGFVYPVQKPTHFHEKLRGTDGCVTKGLLRVRTFCTAPDCGQGSIEAHYNVGPVVSR
jgi:hypothetical protein